jgi:hypothetical protein
MPERSTPYRRPAPVPSPEPGRLSPMPPVQSSQNATDSTLGAAPFAISARSPARTSTRPAGALTRARPRVTTAVTSPSTLRSDMPASTAEMFTSPSACTSGFTEDGGASTHTSPRVTARPSGRSAIAVSPRNITDEPSAKRSSARAPLPVSSSAPPESGIPDTTASNVVPRLTFTSPAASSSRASSVPARSSGMGRSASTSATTATTNTDAAATNSVRLETPDFFSLGSMILPAVEQLPSTGPANGRMGARKVGSQSQTRGPSGSVGSAAKPSSTSAPSATPSTKYASSEAPPISERSAGPVA